MTYNEFIQNILDTRGRFNCGEEYHERHHILPRCCEGTDDEDNLIDLFAREHFVAHKLLVEENPDNKKLVYAWWRMCNWQSHNREFHEPSPEEYEAARKRFSELISGDNNPMKKFSARQKSSKSHLGQILSQETREKLSVALKGKLAGENNPMYGKDPWNKGLQWDDDVKQKMSDSWDYDKHFSYETRQKLSESMSTLMTEEKRKQISEKLNGIKRSESTKKKISESRIGYSPSKETRQKIRESKRGNTNMLGKHHSEETKTKISNGQKYPIYCPELDEEFINISQASKKYNIGRRSINNCVLGKQKYAGNHPVTGEKLTWVKLEK